jgi:hypothetical protein
VTRNVSDDGGTHADGGNGDDEAGVSVGQTCEWLGGGEEAEGSFSLLLTSKPFYNIDLSKTDIYIGRGGCQWLPRLFNLLPD